MSREPAGLRHAASCFLLILGLALAVSADGAETGGKSAKGTPKKTGPGVTPPIVVEPAPLVETVKDLQVIGNGSPESVTEGALAQAVSRGGFITFNTGGAPTKLRITKTLYLPVNTKPTVIDGRNLVTLDGGEKTQILKKAWKTELTVQRLKFINARAEKSGAAIEVENWDGRLSVIDCQFVNCKTTSAGPDIGGGAIRATGQKHFLVSGCTFTDCAGSNGGALCSLGCQLTIVHCRFTNCTAFGTGGGADRGPKGKGGIGGAVYMDGCSQNADKPQLVVSDCLFLKSHAGDHGGAIFAFTYADSHSTSVFNACIFDGSTVAEPKDQGLGFAGAVYSQDCDLYVTNCTFSNNQAPKIGGALFVATPRTVQIANCEFYGNKGGMGDAKGCSLPGQAKVEQVSATRLPKSPAQIYLGRMPGPPAEKESPRKAKQPKSGDDAPAR